MILLVGLGNPDIKYQHTRHNYGFLFIDTLANSLGINGFVEKFNSKIAKTTLANNQDVLLAKPITYMNHSGNALLAIKSFYKIENKNIFVFYDDTEVLMGKIKIKIDGGNGGHNGIKSIDEMIGKDYCRIRMGIGRPQFTQQALSDYVLSEFSTEELDIVNKVNKSLSQNIGLVVSKEQNDWSKAINSTNMAEIAKNNC